MMKGRPKKAEPSEIGYAEPSGYATPSRMPAVSLLRRG